MNKETILQNLESLVLCFAVCLVLFLLTVFIDRFLKPSNRITVYFGLAFIFLGGFFFLNILLLLIELITL